MNPRIAINRRNFTRQGFPSAGRSASLDDGEAFKDLGSIFSQESSVYDSSRHQIISYTFHGWLRFSLFSLTDRSRDFWKLEACAHPELGGRRNRLQD
jgi:hypothetical protein